MSRPSRPPANSDAGGAARDEPGLIGQPVRPRPKKKLNARVASLSRWLHAYFSMLGLFVLLFFSTTGVTLNHPDWFYGGAQNTVEAEGRLDLSWVRPNAPGTPDAGPNAGVDQLQVVEHLRRAHQVRGALAAFNSDENECVVAFKGPGYAADAFIDRREGTYRLTETSHGFVAIINDLHKGRDTGPVWSALIDISAILLVLASLTGLLLMFYIKRRRVSGLVTALVGTAVVLLLARYFVP